MGERDIDEAAVAAGLPHGAFVPPVASAPPETPPGTGWRVFAAVMIFIACAANVLWGIAGLVKDVHLEDRELLFGSVAMWGAILLVVAALQFATALLILARSRFGALVGIVIAAASVVTQLPVAGAYPFWSAVVLVVDGLVIYGLAVHGGRG